MNIFQLRKLTVHYPSFAALSAPEEQRNGAGAGVAADGRADIVYLDLAVEFGEAFLNKRGNFLCILNAAGLSDIALAGIIKAVVCALLHTLDDRLYDLFLRADLFPGNKSAEVIHVKQRTYIEHRSEEACRL
mgnify:CR=1 FL=1